MDAVDDPTLEDLLAAARCAHALRRRRPGVDLAGFMRALRRRAGVAGRHRAVCGAVHARYGDGSISAASALAARGIISRSGAQGGEIGRLRDLLPALGAACMVFSNA